jgi:hypothetical protein
LNDLLEGFELEKIASATEASGGKRGNAPGTTVRTEAIRLLQVRLKDAGFDPGPVDGIPGAKTRAAVERFRSGCTTFKTLPSAVIQLAASSERSNVGGVAMAGNGMSGDGTLGGAAAGRSGASVSAVASREGSGVEGARRPKNRSKDTVSAPVLLDGTSGETVKSTMQLPQTASGKGKTPIRSSSATPPIQY